ncbi:uncharacterized protein LOC122087012 isoform X4 [Macadamia integrifolia]|uniref:uncharacterized protein LOC122087012 isoform X4 n=1 Tax=Macadamia integrifolia TaxID=60698 RepID=UPI001C4FAA8D|nr:uncharacterized protein LOC122087012 isoform X4 [Macadamia integrifolia]
MITPGINLVMTVIGFAVSTMFIVFVCTRLICARIQLSASRRSFPTASRSDLSVLERGLHGLEPVVVATFPTKKFSDNFFASGEDSQWSVDGCSWPALSYRSIHVEEFGKADCVFYHMGIRKKQRKLSDYKMHGMPCRVPGEGCDTCPALLWALFSCDLH